MLNRENLDTNISDYYRISVILDVSVEDKEIKGLLDMSFDLTDKTVKK